MANPVEMRIPFELAPDGGIAVETDPDKQVGQRVRALIRTEPGDRLMNVTLGISLSGLLFEPDDNLTENELLHNVTDLLARYEPGVHVISIRPVPNENEYGVASIEIDYVRTESPHTANQLAQNVNTALIRVGGNVSEVIRG